MKRMSQGKGRESKVKMVYKENERKTPKKPQTNHPKKKENKKYWGNGAMAEGKGRNENAQSLTFGPL